MYGILLFCQKGEVHEKSLNMFSFSENISKMCGFSETYIQKDMPFLASAHAAKCSIIFSSRNNTHNFSSMNFYFLSSKILTSFKGLLHYQLIAQLLS